jgi:hypothetical protein
VSYYPTSATGLNYVTAPPGPTASIVVTLTASGSTNTKGAFAELTSSLGFTCNFLELGWVSATVGGVSFLWDIAIGAAASEVVLIPDLLADYSGSSLCMGTLETIPCGITSGTRVSARCQCSTASATLSAYAAFAATGGVPGVVSFVNYGSLTATSKATTIDPGGSANTKGSYSQLAASTSAVVQSLLVTLSLNVNSAPSTFLWAADVAIGASASEVVLIPDFRTRCFVATGMALVPMSRHFLTYIAGSTRIAMRASCSGTDATDRVISASLNAGVSPGESGGSAGGAWAFA